MNITQVLNAPAALAGNSKMRSTMNIFLWGLQILLALVFLYSGLVKFTQPDQALPLLLPQIFGILGLPLPFIGLLEIICGLGLVLPVVFKALPRVLVMLAAWVLTLLTAVVILSSFTSQLGLLTPIAVGYFLMTLILAYGRWKIVPLGRA